MSLFSNTLFNQMFSDLWGSENFGRVVPKEGGEEETELSPSERSEDSAVNRALRARIRRKLEAVKQEATQLPRLKRGAAKRI